MLPGSLRRFLELVAVLLLDLLPGDPAVAVPGEGHTAAEHDALGRELELRQPMCEWLGVLTGVLPVVRRRPRHRADRGADDPLRQQLTHTPFGAATAR